MLYSNERLDQLNFKGTKIIQSDNVFSFSTDAILLSQFAYVPKSSKAHIIDLCAGNGAIALNLAHKTKAHISLVEIQSKLANMALRSINLNKLSTQLTVYNIPLNQSLKYLKSDSIDSVICNPPYFKINEQTKQNPNHHLAIARHEIKTNLEEVCYIASRLLKTKGHFNLVHRPNRFLEIINTMQKYNLIPKRIRFVYPKIGEEANILLIEGIKNGKIEGLKILSPLFIYDKNGNYTQELIDIYHE